MSAINDFRAALRKAEAATAINATSAARLAIATTCLTYDVQRLIGGVSADMSCRLDHSQE